MVFLNRFPSLLGHVLVAPVAHRERVVDDFELDEYVQLQRVVQSGQPVGNRHVHWHVAPLPPGTPYDEQQSAAFASGRGYLDVPADDLAALAVALGRGVTRLLGRFSFIQ